VSLTFCLEHDKKFALANLVPEILWRPDTATINYVNPYENISIVMAKDTTQHMFVHEFYNTCIYMCGFV